VNRRIVHILLLITFGLLLTTVGVKYLSIPIIAGVFFAFILVSLTLSFISIRKKIAASGPVSGLQTLSSAVIYSSAFGVIIALALIVFHVRHVGRPLLNFSLFSFIVGAFIGIITPIKPTNVTPGEKRQQFLFKGIIYSGFICTNVGVLLSINHYRDGKLLMFGGVSFVFIFLIFLIVFKKYPRSYSR